MTTLLDPSIQPARPNDETFPDLIAHVPLQRRQPRASLTHTLTQRMQKRILGFSLVGGGVLLFALAFLYVLISLLHVEAHLAYFLQTIVSIETNFLLNRFLNWRERDGHLGMQWLKFHSTSLLTITINQILFALLSAIGVHYLVSTFIGAGLAAGVNLVANEWFVFHERHLADRETLQVRAVTPLTRLPHVGVVIPVRNSARTIGKALGSIFNQDYQGQVTVYLVGNAPDEDSTWSAFPQGRRYPNVHMLCIPRPRTVSGRDANMKRYYGSQEAIKNGAEIIAFFDSQVQAPADWLSNAVQLLHTQGTDGLAGISCHQPTDRSLISTYQDASLFSEWPRFGEGFVLRKRNMGETQRLPITANLFFTRDALLAIGKGFMESSVSVGWDDFQIVRQLADLGCSIYCTDQVWVYRNHIRKFRLSKNFASGIGGVGFYRDNPTCPYAQRRVLQLCLVLGLALAAMIGMLLLLTVGNLLAWKCTGISLLVAVQLYSLLSAWRARDIRGLVYLPFDVLHVGAWVCGAVYAFFQGGRIRPEAARAMVRSR